MTALDGMSKGSISEFLLDSRTPGGSTIPENNNYAEEEARREKEVDKQVAELLKETRMWRVANSAQWVAWGIVQAKIPDLAGVMEEKGASAEEVVVSPPTTTGGGESGESKGNGGENDEKGKEKDKDEEEEDEFDYLAYAQDRAMFFWGDVVNMGLVKKEDLPEKLRDRLKIVEY